MASDTNQNIVAVVIGELNKVVQEAREAPVEKESFWRLVSYLDQLNTGKAPGLPLRVQIALNGIKTELVNFQGPLQTCKSKSRLYLLTHCQGLVKEIQKTTHGIGHYLVRFTLAKSTQMGDVGKKADALSREMQQAQFAV
jgi:hypothetical protein